MDLSFAPFDRAASVATVEWPVLLAGAAARQAASRTAAVQAGLARSDRAPCRFAPEDGRFNARAARALAEWKGG